VTIEYDDKNQKQEQEVKNDLEPDQSNDLGSLRVDASNDRESMLADLRQEEGLFGSAIAGQGPISVEDIAVEVVEGLVEGVTRDEEIALDELNRLVIPASTMTFDGVLDIVNAEIDDQPGVLSRAAARIAQARGSVVSPGEVREMLYEAAARQWSHTVDCPTERDLDRMSAIAYA